jgi:biopolymer transport protein ExbD
MDKKKWRINRTEVPSALGRSRSKLSRPLPLLMGLALFMTLLETQCVVTNDVSKFASQSSDALTQGQSVLDDIHGSCVRGYMATRDITESLNENLQFNTQADEAANIAQKCKIFADDQRGLEALSNVLKLYFTTISQLASAGTSTDTAKKNASEASNQGNTATSSKPSSVKNVDEVVNSASAVANILTNLFVRAYGQKKLAQALEHAHPHVVRVLDALSDVTQTQYLGTKEHEAKLQNERKLLELQIETELNYWKNNKNEQLVSLAPSIEVLYRDQWDRQIAIIAAKQAAAQAYIKALEQIKEGHSKLAAQASKAGGFSAKQILALLQPYIQNLSELIPKIKTSF